MYLTILRVIYIIREYQTIINFSNYFRRLQVGWLGELNVGLKLHNGILLTVWDSSIRMIRSHAITILIRHGGDGSPALVLPEV